MVLDKRSIKLLTYLTVVCEDGNFKVIERQDLAKAVSKKADSETVQSIVKFLQDNDMIDKKYSDETKYCLAVFPKGRVYIETLRDKKQEVVISRRLARFIIVGSFLAALAGVLIANILMKLLG